jgi:large subunit ribosomal protein L24
MAQRKRYHIKRDDIVMVVAGKEKGKTGKVLKIFPKKDRAVVEKVNFIKRPPGRYRGKGEPDPNFQPHGGVWQMH